MENQRDWERYQKLLHPRVEWTLFSQDGRQDFSGAAAYMEKIKGAYSCGEVKFRCREMVVSANGNRIAALLENTLGEVAVDIFEFQDGLIVREYEYLMS